MTAPPTILTSDRKLCKVCIVGVAGVPDIITSSCCRCLCCPVESELPGGWAVCRGVVLSVCVCVSHGAVVRGLGFLGIFNFSFSKKLCTMLLEQIKGFYHGITTGW